MQFSPSPIADTFYLSDKVRRLLQSSLIFALIARLICNAVIPLTDTTEARYGEIARKMLETGDWITPQHDYGVPFWAKPPLSTWLSAFSMKLFGVTEFAVRLPSLLLSVGLLLLVWQWTRAQRNRDFALMVCAVLASMSLFFVASGAVMTDESLAFCTTLAMMSFWQAINAEPGSPRSKRWGYLFFVALGCGILAKGLLAGVLTLLPIAAWIVVSKTVAKRKNDAVRDHGLSVLQSLPWFRGLLLMLAISLPWYIAAERKTPGFLAYFIVGEHFGRFMHSGWNGDKYGNAHAEAFGMIWIFLIAAAMPWSLVAIAKVKSSLPSPAKTAAASDGWISYLAMWSFIPILFFTFAHNIIWTYPLPALPAVAALIVEILRRSSAGNTVGLRLAASSFVTPAILLAFAALYAGGYHGYLKSSQKDGVAYFLQHRPEADSGLYYFHRRYYSSEFYSGGKARTIETDGIFSLFNNGHTDYLMIHPRDFSRLPAPLRSHFETAGRFGDFVMLRELHPHIAMHAGA